MGAGQGKVPPDGGPIRPAGFQAGQRAPRSGWRRFHGQLGQHEIRGDGGRGLQPLGVVQRFQGAGRIAGLQAHSAQRLPDGCSACPLLHGGFQATSRRRVAPGGVERRRHVAIEPWPKVVVLGFPGRGVQRMVKGFARGCAVAFGGVANSQAGEVKRRKPSRRAGRGGVNRQQRALSRGVNGARCYQVCDIVAAILDVRHVVGRVRAAA